MQNKIILSTIIIIIFIIMIAIFPVRFAVKEKNIEQNNYIIVKVVYTTQSNWEIIGDEHGSYDRGISVDLKGNVPDIVGFNIIEGSYICYGEYKDDVITPAGYKNKVFLANGWDFMYPIKRDIFDFLPKSWICLIDILFHN